MHANESKRKSRAADPSKQAVFMAATASQLFFMHYSAKHTNARSTSRPLCGQSNRIRRLLQMRSDIVRPDVVVKARPNENPLMPAGCAGCGDGGFFAPYFVDGRGDRR
jgi:hypothetical protein